MKFGKVNDPSCIDFTLPKDDAQNVFLTSNAGIIPNISVGCAKWNKQDLKGFYPRGTKDELEYYSKQFNSIELNATFYRIFSKEQVLKWKEKTPDHFKFYPKIPQVISQFKRLKDCDSVVTEYLDSILHLEEKLGMIFLQMPPNFGPKNQEILEKFIHSWHPKIPLALELRHADWYGVEEYYSWLKDLLTDNGITHIITDTAGRRDLVHMHLSTPKTFIRYTGANHESDYTRLLDWKNRIKLWIENGMEEINFFVHQNLEKESPLLSSFLINELNKEFQTKLSLPNLPSKDLH